MTQHAAKATLTAHRNVLAGLLADEKKAIETGRSVGYFNLHAIRAMIAEEKGIIDEFATIVGEDRVF